MFHARTTQAFLSSGASLLSRLYEYLVLDFAAKGRVRILQTQSFSSEQVARSAIHRLQAMTLRIRVDQFMAQTGTTHSSSIRVVVQQDRALWDWLSGLRWGKGCRQEAPLPLARHRASGPKSVDFCRHRIFRA